MTRPSPLLTVDEAQQLLGTAAIALVDTWTGSPARLTRILHGHSNTNGLSPQATSAARSWRQARRTVEQSGLGQVIDDQIAGALSYAAPDFDHTVGSFAA